MPERKDQIVRELRRLAIRIEALHDDADIPTEYGTMVDMLAQAFRPIRAKENDPAEILRVVAIHYGVKTAAIVSKDRTMHITAARQVAMYLARELTNATFPMLGRLFGRDHSTVVYAHGLIAKRAASEPRFSTKIEVLRAEILGIHRPTRAELAVGAKYQEAAA